MAELKVCGEVKICDCCFGVRGLNKSDAVIKGKTYYDAPYGSRGGIWMNFCRNCYNDYAAKGIGTMFRKDENGEWKKDHSLIKKTKKQTEMDRLCQEIFGLGW